MTPVHPWDLLVVGGGTAGIVAAKTAARLGSRVLLVESHRTGGDCLWTGCVPSKALLAVAHAAATARTGSRFGVHSDGVHVDFGEAMAHVRRSIAEIAPVDSPAALEAAGVTVMSGRARFVGPGLAEVDGEQVPFRQAVLATGAEPALPPIPGLDQAEALTSETIWELVERPGALAVLGGGSIGCELGQAMARLGSSVTLVEGAARILPREDREASELIDQALRADGVEVLPGRTVTAVEPERARSASGRLVLDDGSHVDFDRLLVAVGRTPRTQNLRLEAVGVDLDQHGFVIVDQHLRTTHDRIWAAGDLTGHPQFTHLAGVHGSLAASNAVLGLRRSVDRSGVPRVTYTHPEVAAVGIDTGRSRGGVRVLTLTHEHVDRAVVEGETAGLTKLAVDRKGRILGATVVAPRAGEMLGELAVAVKRGLRTRDLAGVTHAYPTWNDGPWNAALADVREQLERPATQRLLRSAAATRRWWLDRRGG